MLLSLNLKKEQSPLVFILQCVLCNWNFAPTVYCNFSARLLDFHKGILVCGWLSKISVLWENEGGRKLLFRRFDDVTHFVDHYCQSGNKHILQQQLLLVVQSLSRVPLFVTPWTPAHQAPLSFTISLSLLRFMSIESVSNNFILFCLLSFCPQSFPMSGSFPMSWFFASGGQSIGASASASVLPMNIQSWFPLGLTGLISLQSKGLSRVFSSTTVWKHQFFSAQPA